MNEHRVGVVVVVIVIDVVVVVVVVVIIVIVVVVNAALFLISLFISYSTQSIVLYISVSFSMSTSSFVQSFLSIYAFCQFSSCLFLLLLCLQCLLKCDQCDQIGRFSNVMGNFFVSKVAQMYSEFWALLKNIPFDLATFWATFEKLGHFNFSIWSHCK